MRRRENQNMSIKVGIKKIEGKEKLIESFDVVTLIG
jgi:hypothetical protein